MSLPSVALWLPAAVSFLEQPEPSAKLPPSALHQAQAAALPRLGPRLGAAGVRSRLASGTWKPPASSCEGRKEFAQG